MPSGTHFKLGMFEGVKYSCRRWGGEGDIRSYEIFVVVVSSFVSIFDCFKLTFVKPRLWNLRRAKCIQTGYFLLKSSLLTPHSSRLPPIFLSPNIPLNEMLIMAAIFLKVLITRRDVFFNLPKISCIYCIISDGCDVGLNKVHIHFTILKSFWCILCRFILHVSVYK